MVASTMSGAARMAARFARRLAAVIAEMDRAQRRAAVLFVACDRYLDHPGQPPQTYGEFLPRTNGPLVHEPSAAARRTGRMVG
jgi:hypothetical protein